MMLCATVAPFDDAVDAASPWVMNVSTKFGGAVKPACRSNANTVPQLPDCPIWPLGVHSNRNTMSLQLWPETARQC